MMTPRVTKHSRGAEIVESAWVESNYRPHAYQGRACVVHIRRPAWNPSDCVVCTFIFPAPREADTQQSGPETSPEM